MSKSVVTLYLLLAMALAACQPITLEGHMSIDATDGTMEEVTSAESDENIVIGIISAPATAGGIVAGQPTGINILLNAPTTEDRYFSDPAHFGHQIPAGGWLEVEVGGSFIRNGVDNDAEFVPIEANAHMILLSGNPQNAIVQAAGPGPQHANYAIEDDGDRTFTIRPNGGEGANGLEGDRATEIGLKVIHILSSPLGSSVGPPSFQNGAAGTEGTVAVRIYDADGTILESGTGSITFPASVGRQVNPINFGLATPMQFSPEVSTELIEATNFQRVSPGTQLINTQREGLFTDNAPYAPRFLLMEAIELQPDPYGPMVGIPNVGMVVDSENPAIADLVQDANDDGILDEDDTVIGQVTISGPSDESSGQILDISDWPLTVSGDGVEGPPGSFFSVPIAVGAEAGIYATTVALEDGGSATIFTVVE